MIGQLDPSESEKGEREIYPRFHHFTSAGLFMVMNVFYHSCDLIDLIGDRDLDHQSAQVTFLFLFLKEVPLESMSASSFISIFVPFLQKPEGPEKRFG